MYLTVGCRLEVVADLKYLSNISDNKRIVRLKAAAKKQA